MLDPIKILKCKECGVDVKVNANYPITEVNCRDWYCPKTGKKDVTRNNEHA
jgi:hypothetical protein